MARMKTRTLTRIGIFSAARLMGITYAMLGVLLGGMFALMSVVGWSIIPKGNGAPDIPFGGAVIAVAAIVFFPILYGTFGFIGGAIAAAVYNLVARWIGGLELELSD
jgi:hypothetical protein